MTDEEIKSKSYDEIKTIFFENWDKNTLMLNIVNDMIFNEIDILKNI